MSTELRAGRYQHYKGAEYTLLGIARHSETLDELVVYRPEYGDRGLWVRPRAMFGETIEVGGRVVRRFRCIEPPLSWSDELELRRSRPADLPSLRELHTKAFGGRADEANLIEALLAGGWAEVSLVAEHAEQLVGHILFSRIEIVARDATHVSLSLAPVSVLPDHQRKGAGRALIAAGLDLARQAGFSSVFVLGEPDYYGRFGFNADLARRFDCVYASDAFMALELSPGSLQGLQGEVHYPTPFAGL